MNSNIVVFMGIKKYYYDNENNHITMRTTYRRNSFPVCKSCQDWLMAANRKEKAKR
jgi:hypothetical protein